MKHIPCAICGAEISVVKFELQKGSDSERYLINECQRCSHVYMDPQPTSSELTKFYREDYYYDDFFSPEFIKQSYQFYRELRQLLKPGMKVLDVGCSKGFLMNFIKRAGCEVEGVEISKDAAAFATREFGIKVHNEPVDELKLPVNHYDLIIAFDLIEHVAKPIETLKLFRSWLKPGGHLVLDTPNYDSIYRRIAQDRWAGFDMPYHINSFRPKTLQRALRDAGFQNIELTSSHFNPFSREGLVRGKWFGLQMAVVKMARITGLWEKMRRSYRVEPVAHENHQLERTRPETTVDYNKPPIGLIDILESGLNIIPNKVADQTLWGDGIRSVAQRPR